MKSSGLFICITGFIFFLASSCTQEIKPESLHGEWKYVKVEGLSNPADNVSDEELTDQAPYIRFSKNGELLIMWGGKVLSTGNFKVEGNIIRYTETLQNGATRPIPFLVKKLNEKELVFETMEQENTRITAQIAKKF